MTQIPELTEKKAYRPRFQLCFTLLESVQPFKGELTNSPPACRCLFINDVSQVLRSITTTSPFEKDTSAAVKLACHLSSGKKRVAALLRTEYLDTQSFSEAEVPRWDCIIYSLLVNDKADGLLPLIYPPDLPPFADIGYTNDTGDDADASPEVISQSLAWLNSIPSAPYEPVPPISQHKVDTLPGMSC